MDRAALVIGGLAIGVLLAVGGFVAADWLSDDDSGLETRPLDDVAFPALDHNPEAAAGLLDAWERWRNATFVTSGTWTRELDIGGDPLIGPSYRAQDPPRRLVTRLGSTVERVDGSISVCDAGDEDFDAPGCIGGETLTDYADRVAAEMVVVADYVGGDARTYDVAFGESEGCFRAEILVVSLVAPWGRWAEFCFDEGTGALVSSRVRRPSAVDTEVLRVVSDTVTDADFGVEVR